ncbi:MAG: ABC-F family ATP-binding cassette domain-containing protein [Bacteroidaceae bacterium]|nr:ABC-F family ATP-binding cassette domain-containing protein [Bacteroidaceae bacterium]
MISIENLKVEFGATPLFQGVSYIINPKDRIALVGKNGAGKSTMLKILAGLQQPTDGMVAMPKDITVSYLPQVMKLTDTRTVREETELAFAHIGEQRRLVDRLGAELAERTDYESDDYHALIDRFAHENERLQIIGGDSYHAEMEQTLCGLGFGREDLDRPTAEFSGGWRMRIELAKLLLQHPDVLLLDEPTNHLDIESIQWLEGFLARSAKAVVLVSHDRAFINNVTNRTIEITCGTIHDYRVKYDEYVELRRERREQQLRAYENQQKEIADITDFIERFRYKPTKAIQVQSRIKQLEKMVPVVIDEEDRSTLRLKFRPAQRSGNYPIICEDVGKTYGGPLPTSPKGEEAQTSHHTSSPLGGIRGGLHLVFKDVNLTIRRGEKVAFVGKNGEGKSTLVKCIMGEIPYEGKLTIGHNVEIGYFAQNQAQLLDEELTVFDTIDRVAVGDIRLKIRDILGAFMFGGEASDKKVKVLSGGERSRLAMIKLLLEQVNLLILDEPTNHLDMRSKDVLKEAIRDFDGTVIIVSHDREFLDGLVTKVYEFGGGKVREHLGGIYDYLQKKETGTPAPLLSPQGGKVKDAMPASPPSGEDLGGAASYAARKEQAKAQRKLQKRVEECEKRVTQIEAEIKELEEWMATPTGAANQALFEQYAQLKATLAAAEAEWEEAMMEMEDN